MIRSYRNIVFALVGFLSLAAAQAPNNRAKPQQPTPSAKIERSLETIAASQNKIAKASNPGRYQEPCEAGQPNDKSDLCAQWYAARAARDAANWARWSLVVGVIGAAGIVVALLLTIQSNRIARDTAKRQLRAYLSLSDVEIEIGDSHLAVRPRLHNSGQTQAIGVTLCLPMVASATGFKPALIQVNGAGKELCNSVGVIPPGVKTELIWFGWNSAISKFADVPDLVISSGQRHTVMVACSGHIEWEDIFGGGHHLSVSILWERLDISTDKHGRTILTGTPVIIHGHKRTENRAGKEE